MKHRCNNFFVLRTRENVLLCDKNKPRKKGSMPYVYAFSRWAFNHPFSGSDRSGILRGIRSGSSYRRCRRLTV